MDVGVSISFRLVYGIASYEVRLLNGPQNNIELVAVAKSYEDIGAYNTDSV